jgi:hypothetical protein
MMDDHNRDHDADADATSVTHPDGPAEGEDEGTFDPEMTDADEANVPEGSEADPKA